MGLYLNHRHHRNNNNRQYLLDLHLQPLILNLYMHLYPRQQLQARLYHQEGRPHRLLNVVGLLNLVSVQTHLVLLPLPLRTEHLQ